MLTRRLAVVDTGAYTQVYAPVLCWSLNGGLFGARRHESSATNMEGRKLQLHYWYIYEQEYESGTHRIGHGIVTGHNRLPDSVYILLVISNFCD